MLTRNWYRALLLMFIVGLLTVSIYYMYSRRPPDSFNGTSASVTNTSEEGTPPQPTETLLTDFERQYLLWLLLQRQEAGLASVPVKHHYTMLAQCSDCYILYYSWGEEPTIALIHVEFGEIREAVDSSGYDYLDHTRGEPIDFPELTDVDRS